MDCRVPSSHSRAPWFPLGSCVTGRGRMVRERRWLGEGLGNDYKAIAEQWFLAWAEAGKLGKVKVSITSKGEGKKVCCRESERQSEWVWRSPREKTRRLGLPWWCSGWESACQCRGRGFGPWSGRIPHAAEQLGPWATIAEPARLEPVLLNERGRDSERPAHRDEEWPPLATTRESPRTETKTQHSQK